MVKYKAYFTQMCEENKSLFSQFADLHAQYQLDKKSHQTAFNDLGDQVRHIVEDWDRRLCGHMEKGNNAAYSARLSEKFWGEVRRLFPLIDFVGAKIR